MNIERELSLTNFSNYLEAYPNQVKYVAFQYYNKFLDQQNKISNLEQNCHDLEQNCQELEQENQDIYADYELLRLALEEEQSKNIDSDLKLHLELPNFLPSNPHNYL